MLKENGKIVRCPICKSKNVVPVHPFDYIKMCENKDCPYYKKTKGKWKYQWYGEHN